LKLDQSLGAAQVHYTGIGGQWGQAFGLTQWKGTYQLNSDGTGYIATYPTGAVKIDIEPFSRN